MTKVAIVGPDTDYLVGLEQKIHAYCPGWTVSSIINDISTIPESWNAINSSILFLSLDYGVEIIKDFFTGLQSHPQTLVFMTSQKTVMIDYFQYQPIDFLFNPLKESDIVRIYQKVKQRELDADSSLRFLYTNQVISGQTGAINNIAVPTMEGFVFLSLDEIIRMEANGAYTHIHTLSGNKLVSSRNIREFEKQLSAHSFFRVHNSHLVNIRRLLKYEKGRGGVLIMQDGSKVLVSSRRKMAFFSLFQ
mgnify:CR=1 FL=1